MRTVSMICLSSGLLASAAEHYAPVGAAHGRDACLTHVSIPLDGSSLRSAFLCLTRHPAPTNRGHGPLLQVAPTNRGEKPLSRIAPMAPTGHKGAPTAAGGMTRAEVLLSSKSSTPYCHRARECACARRRTHEFSADSRRRVCTANCLRFHQQRR